MDDSTVVWDVQDLSAIPHVNNLGTFQEYAIFLWFNYSAHSAFSLVQ